MSGPKVIKVLTKEERAQIVGRRLNKLQRVLQRWEETHRRLNCFSEQKFQTFRSRYQQLDYVPEQNELDQLVGEVNSEIAFLNHEIQQVKTEAIKFRTKERLNINWKDYAHTLLLHKDLSESKRQQLQAALDDNSSENEIKEMVSQLLIGDTGELSTTSSSIEITDRQKQIITLLQNDLHLIQPEKWQAPVEEKDNKWLRLQSLISELEIFFPEQFKIYSEQLNTLAQREHQQDYYLYFDSLLLNVQSIVQTQRELVQQIEILEDLLNELPAEHFLLEQAKLGIQSKDKKQIQQITVNIQQLLQQKSEYQAAQSKRKAILNGLAELGYKVQEGMATLWAENGHLIVQKSSIPEYGVEIIGNTQEKIQMRTVCFSEEQNTQRDTDAEILWCDSFGKLQNKLFDQEITLSIEKQIEAGAIPVKHVSAAYDQSKRENTTGKKNTF